MHINFLNGLVDRGRPKHMTCGFDHNQSHSMIGEVDLMLKSYRFGISSGTTNCLD